MTTNPFGSAPIKDCDELLYFSPQFQEKYNEMSEDKRKFVLEYITDSVGKVMKEIDDEIIAKINQCSDPDCEPHNYCEKCCPRKKLEDL